MIDETLDKEDTSQKKTGKKYAKPLKEETRKKEYRGKMGDMIYYKKCRQEHRLKLLVECPVDALFPILADLMRRFE